MRVDDLLRQIVVFVGYETASGFVPYGTGFLCRFNLEEIGTTFVATAQHVIDVIPGDSVFVRINRKGGGCGTIRLSKTGYQLRPSDSVLDMAMIATTLDQSIYEYLCLPLNRDVAAQQKKEIWEEPKIGDEVCVAGLYTSHYGNIRNIPIVRVGHLAAMPEEPVRTNAGYLEGYLIELHSIAGLSGSPVFVTPPYTKIDKRGQISHRKDEIHVPLGMLIGHHVIETKEDEILVEGYATDGRREPGALTEKNTGFGVVVPIERFYEAVETAEFRRDLTQALLKNRQVSGFKRDSSAERA